MFAVVSGDNKGNDGETAGPDRALLFLFLLRHEPDGNPREQEEEDQRDFCRRHQGILQGIECLPRDRKPSLVELIDAVACENKTEKPDGQQRDAFQEAPDENPCNDLKSCRKFRL